MIKEAEESLTSEKCVVASLSLQGELKWCEPGWFCWLDLLCVLYQMQNVYICVMVMSCWAATSLLKQQWVQLTGVQLDASDIIECCVFLWMESDLGPVLLMWRRVSVCNCDQFVQSNKCVTWCWNQTVCLFLLCSNFHSSSENQSSNCCFFSSVEPLTHKHANTWKKKKWNQENDHKVNKIHLKIILKR